MIIKSEKIIVTFYTTTAAMNMEDVCKAKGIGGRLVPLPATITAECGLGWCADPCDEAVVKKIMAENNIEYQHIHRCMI